MLGINILPHKTNIRKKGMLKKHFSPQLFYLILFLLRKSVLFLYSIYRPLSYLLISLRFYKTNENITWTFCFGVICFFSDLDKFLLLLYLLNRVAKTKPFIFDHLWSFKRLNNFCRLNYWLKSLNIISLEPTNLNSIKVPNVFSQRMS